MTREEGISNLMQAWRQRDSEFAVNDDEFAASDKELCDSLLALGVTEEELRKRGYNISQVDALAEAAEPLSKASGDYHRVYYASEREKEGPRKALEKAQREFNRRKKEIRRCE